MISDTKEFQLDLPSIDLAQIKKFLKRTWLRVSIFSDRMAIARLSSELANSGKYKEAKIAIKNIGEGHAAKMRLLRRLSK